MPDTYRLQGSPKGREFIDEDGGGPGVRLRKRDQKNKSGGTGDASALAEAAATPTHFVRFIEKPARELRYPAATGTVSRQESVAVRSLRGGHPPAAAAAAVPHSQPQNFPLSDRKSGLQ